jgi:hypothetical protein
MANPSREHWNVVQWILRYLCGSSNACLCFVKYGDGLFCYVDSMDTWPTMYEDTKSFIRRCVRCQKHGNINARDALPLTTNL